MRAAADRGGPRSDVAPCGAADRRVGRPQRGARAAPAQSSPASGVDEIIVDVSLENGEDAGVLRTPAGGGRRERARRPGGSFVTGASGGIGSVTAARSSAHRAQRLVAHTTAPTATGPRQAVAVAPRDAIACSCRPDLRAAGSRAALFAEALAWRGRVDVVVVNAAIAAARRRSTAADELLGRRLGGRRCSVNVLEPVSLMREARPPLRRRRRRHDRSRSRAGLRSAARRSRSCPRTPPRRRRRSERGADDRARTTRATASSPTSSHRASCTTPMSEISAVARGRHRRASTRRSRWARWSRPRRSPS